MPRSAGIKRRNYRKACRLVSAALYVSYVQRASELTSDTGNGTQLQLKGSMERWRREKFARDTEKREQEQLEAHKVRYGPHRDNCSRMQSRHATFPPSIAVGLMFTFLGT